MTTSARPCRRHAFLPLLWSPSTHQMIPLAFYGQCVLCGALRQWQNIVAANLLENRRVLV